MSDPTLSVEDGVPGGRFVLELQEWSSYKKKKALTEQFKKNCAAIQIRPEMFREYLLKVPAPTPAAACAHLEHTPNAKAPPRPDINTLRRPEINSQDATLLASPVTAKAHSGVSFQGCTPSSV